MNAMKTLQKFALSGALAVTAVSANAYESNDRIVEAQVLSSQAIYTTVQINDPVQQCWQEAVSVPQKTYKTRTPEIFGAIIGAGVGRLFGSGRGQDAATVAGAVLGGSIGRDQNSTRNTGTATVRYEQRCKVVDNFRTENRFEGYDVTYEYNGSVYHARTQSHPGDTITVSVNVVPLET